MEGFIVGLIVGGAIMYLMIAVDIITVSGGM